MPNTDLTATLVAHAGGDRRAGDVLLQSVYAELRELAARKLGRERAGHVLQPTALVHEAYLKLVDQSRVDWQGRTHFYAVAAQAMDRLLVDMARSRDRRKRGGGWRRVTLDDAFDLGARPEIDVQAVHEALERMEAIDPRQALVVKFRFLAGLSVEETAAVLGVGARTVDRDWKMGRAWLRRELAPSGRDSGPADTDVEHRS